MVYVGMAAGVLWVVMVLFVVAMCRASAAAEASEDARAAVSTHAATAPSPRRAADIAGAAGGRLEPVRV